jgi:hypothetical protein
MRETVPAALPFPRSREAVTICQLSAARDF